MSNKINKIRTELPVFARCCLCFPLRHGLIVWGFIRMITSLAILVIATKTLIVILHEEHNYGIDIGVILRGLFISFAVVDIALSIVLIIAGSKKNLKLMKVYYIYSFIVLVLTIILGVLSTGYVIYLLTQQETLLGVWIIVYDLLTILAQIFIQAYILLLVKSAFIKLRNKYELKSVNNAEDTECTLQCEEVNLTNVNKEVSVNETNNAEDPECRKYEEVKLTNVNKEVSVNETNEPNDTSSSNESVTVPVRSDDDSETIVYKTKNKQEIE